MHTSIGQVVSKVEEKKRSFCSKWLIFKFLVIFKDGMVCIVMVNARAGTPLADETPETMDRDRTLKQVIEELCDGLRRDV